MGRRYFLAAIALAALPALIRADDVLPATPVAVVPSATPGVAMGRPTANVTAAPSPLGYAPPPPLTAAPPGAGPFIDPGPGGWGPAGGPSLPPGPFFRADLLLAFPAVKFKISPDVPPPSGVPLSVPTVDLPATLSPLFELGYRLPNSAGFFAASYRFLISEETAPRALDREAVTVRTRLNIHVVDLDYGVDPIEFAPRYTYSWRIGARIADVFFDNRVQREGLTQQASNKFFGAGPHARLDIERRIVPIPGLSLLGGIDGAMLIGQVRQRYREEYTASPALAPVVLLPAPFTAESRRSQAVPYLNLQLGLSYVPPNLPNVKFSAGYQFEEFFNVGKLGVDGRGVLSQSRGEVWAQGLFLRGQVDY